MAPVLLCPPQTRFSPYMSVSKSRDVLDEHHNLKKSDPVHKQVRGGRAVPRQSRFSNYVLCAGGQRPGSNARKNSSKGGIQPWFGYVRWPVAGTTLRGFGQHVPHAYLNSPLVQTALGFLDYNTVENALLACGVVIVTAGLMFQSARCVALDSVCPHRCGC